MHVVGQRLHVGKLRVCVQHAVGVALALPGVVDVYVDVTSVFHSSGDELIGGRANVLVGDAAGEEVPTVPAHRRSQCHLRPLR